MRKFIGELLLFLGTAFIIGVLIVIGFGIYMTVAGCKDSPNFYGCGTRNVGIVTTWTPFPE